MEKFELILKMGESGIETNVDEVTALVTGSLKKYQYLVDAGSYAVAKKDAAALRRLAKESKAERLRIEHQLLDGWQESKSKLMALEKTLEATADKLADGCKALDREEQEAKYKALEQFWNQLCNCQTPFTAVFDKRYLNKSAKEAQSQEDLRQKWQLIQIDWDGIAPMLTGYEKADQEVHDYFFRTLDKVGTFQKLKEFERVLSQPEPKPVQPPVAQQVQQVKTVMPFADLAQPEPVQPEKRPEPVHSEPEKQPLLLRSWVTEGTREQYETVWKAMKACGLKIIEVKKLN